MKAGAGQFGPKNALRRFSSRRGPSAASFFRRLYFEPLEDRSLLAVLTATPQVLPNGNLLWEVVYDAQDGAGMSAAADLRFQGDIVQVLSSGVIAVDTVEDANIFDGEAGYTAEQDSWFYADGSGTDGAWVNLFGSSLFPQNTTGIAGMQLGSNTAYFAGGTLTGVNATPIAHIVTLPSSQLRVDGILARQGNTYPVDYTFTAEFPDLTVTQVDVPSNMYAGYDLDLSYELNNVGTAPALFGGTSNLWLSTDDQLDESDYFLDWDFVYESLEPDFFTLRTNVTAVLPLGISGTYYVLVEADDLNEVQESNELNNVTASLPFEVTDIPLAYSDSAATRRNRAVEIDVLANDYESGSPIDPTSVEIQSPAEQGQVAVNPVTGVITYTPNPGFLGQDQFTYTVRDELGVPSLPATVYVSVELHSVNFGPQQILTDEALSAQSVFAADLDGDGDADVLSAAYDDGTIFWHENLGAGIFDTPKIVTNELYGPAAVYSADLDGDGDWDVLSASFYSIDWMENLGNGSFAFPVTISFDVVGAQSLETADLDGDGDLDVLSASWYDDTVAWYENLGGDVFGSQQIISTEAISPESVTTADLDGDGDLDVLSASQDDALIAWYENLGGGVFGSQQIITSEAFFAEDVYAADLDGDGDLDVLSASISSVDWYENLGNGQFGPQQMIALEADGPESVTAADLDGDGDLDVLVASWYDDDRVAWYENLGSGFFGPQQTITTQAWGAEAAQAVDLDGDGDLDVLSASQFDDKIAWYENLTIHSTASFPEVRTIDTLSEGGSAVVSTDVNRDGIPDLVIASIISGSPFLNWYLGNGDGTFGSAIPFGFDFPSSIDDLAAGDFDNDGWQDIAAATSNGVMLYLNTGGGLPSFGGTVDTINATSLAVGDFNRDGRFDLAATESPFVSGELLLYLNEGAGSFAEPIPISPTGNEHVTAGDLDRDGDLDLVVAGGFADGVGWYANLGGAAFSSIQWIDASLSFPVHVELADGDGDGDLDVFAANGVQIALYKNEGGGTFSAASTVASGESFVDLRLGDLDDDGDADFVAVASGRTYWFWGAGDGSFSPGTQQPELESHSGTIELVDLDRDGRLDVVSLGGGSGSGAVDLVWYPNLGAPASLTTAPLDPELLQGASGAVLTLELTNSGRPGDSGVELSTIGLLLQDALATPLTSNQANAVIDQLRVFRDSNQNGSYDPGVDELVATNDNLTLANGVLTFTLPDDEPLLEDGADGTPARFFLVADLTADAATQGLGSVTFTHLTDGSENSSQVEDAAADIGLRIESSANISSTLAIAGAPALPDLVITDVSVTPSAQAGDAVTVFYTLNNLGGDANVDMQVRFYLSTDQNFDLADLLLGTDSVVQTLTTNEPAALSKSIELPLFFTGTFYVLARADALGEVEELDEDNNIGVSGSIEIAPPPNEPPVAQSDQARTRENLAIEIGVLLNDGDIDGTLDPTTVQISSPPQHGQVSVDAQTGKVTYTPATDFTGVDVFAYTVRDDQGVPSPSASVMVTVAPWTVPFGTQQEISADVIQPISVIAADLDGDGDLDVLSASYEDNKITWYENLGGGSYGSQLTITDQATGAYCVYAADLDGDGDLDVLSASLSDDLIAWNENLGGGTFGSLQTITDQAFEAYSVTAADLDGDSDLDVLSASRFEDRVAWYENLGNQSFGPMQTITVGEQDAQGAQSVVAADLDGDGDLDVVSASYSGNRISWHENLGGGVFGALQQITDQANEAWMVSVADLDGDGDVDVLSASTADDKIAWYENLGGGEFGPQQVISTEAALASAVVAADMDGDGDLDVLSASQNDDKVAWYENLGGGVFGPQQIITALADGAISVYPADLDGDGDLDVLSAAIDGNKIAWYENRAIHHTSVFPEVRTIDTLSEGGSAVVSTDVNRDGISDLVVASLNSGSPFLNWYLGNADGTFGFAIPFGFDFPSAILDLAAGDFDNDGWQDIAAATSNGVMLYLNTGGGLPSFGGTVDTINATSLAVGDFNRDGRLDLAASESPFSSGAVFLYLNQGEGVFAEPSTVAPTGSQYVTAGDLDGDGDLDLVVAGGILDWYENLGDATFSSMQWIDSNLSFPEHVELADVDGDGDLDVFAANGVQIALYKNEGGGTFSAASTVASGESFVDLRLGDLDNDGDVDFVAVASSRTYWFWGAGDGSFSPGTQQPELEPHSGTIELVDLDRDGRLDVVSLGGGGATNLVWYPNLAAQATLTSQDLAPAEMLPGQTTPLLSITLNHGGREGDSSIELASLNVLLEESNGDPLDNGEAAGLFERVFLFRDANGNGTYEDGLDQLVTSINTFVLDAGVLSFTLSDDDPNALVSPAAPATFFVVAQLTSDAGTSGPATFRISHRAPDNIRLEDSAADIALEHVFKSLEEGNFVAVVQENSPPELEPISDQSINEGVLLSIQASATDPDVPANTLTYSLGAGAPEGASIDPVTGLFRWTPTEAQGPGVYAITIHVTDDGDPALEAFETFNVTVAEVNLAPVLTPIEDQVVDEGAELIVLAIATDPDNPTNTLTFSLDPGAPEGASIDPVTGLFRWTPTEAQGPGEYGITIRVTDNGEPALEAFETFNVTVAEVNLAPVLNPIEDQLVDEEVLLTVQATAFDADDPTNILTYSLDPGAPEGASIDPVTGLFRWTPTEGQGPGVYEITIRVTDDGEPALEDFVTFAVTVGEIISRPVLNPIEDQVVDEGSLLTIQVLVTDPDIPTNILTYSLGIGAPEGAAIDPVTGEFHWTPTEAQGPGVYPITIRVTDNGEPPLEDSLTFNVTVGEVNSAPVLEPITDKFIDEGGTLALIASASDPDIPANSLTYSLGSGSPEGATLNPITGEFLWTPTEAQGPGVYEITIRVTDNGEPAREDSVTFNVTVNEVNSAPVIDPIADQVIDEGDLLTIQASATDPDDPANTLSYTLDPGAPEGATIDPVTGLFRWTPTEAQGPGEYTITIRVTDNGQPVLEDSVTFNVKVEANTPPVIGPIADQFIDETTLLTIQVSAFDADFPTNTLTYTLDPGAPEGATIDPVTGLFRWTPAEAQGPGLYPITIRVTDNGQPALSDSVTFNVIVGEVNSVPVFEPITDKFVDEEQQLSFVVSATDSDQPANTLTFTLDPGAPTGANIDPVTGLFTWTPTEAQGPGLYEITIRVADNGQPALAATVRLNVTVSETNAAPVLESIIDEQVNEGEKLSFTATATDPDIPTNTLNYSLGAGAPEGATIDPITGQFQWTPTEAQGPGVYAITIRVTDNGEPALDDSVTFNVTVVEVNTAPILAPISHQQVDESQLLTFVATATDLDVPANSLTYSLGPGAPEGATIDPVTGVFRWTPTEAQGAGVYAITIRVTDNGAPPLLDSVTFNVTVAEVNSAPILTSIADKQVNEGEPLTFVATATDPDIPANMLTYDLGPGAPDGATIDPITGLFRWTPSEAQGPGVYSITIRVTDHGQPALTNEVTFQVTVVEVNAAPMLAPIADRLVDETVPLTFMAAATDPDAPANTLVYSLGEGAPAGATIDPETGLFSWTPSEAQSGVHSITIRVTDSGQPVLQDSRTFSVTVAEVNTPPVLDGIANRIVSEGGLVEFFVVARDADLPHNPLSFALLSAPAGATIEPVTGLFRWTAPASAPLQSYQVTVAVSDGEVIDTKSFIIWVQPLPTVTSAKALFDATNVRFEVYFSSGNMLTDNSAGSVTSLANYRLLRAGGDSTFTDGNEVSIPLEFVTYDTLLRRATITPAQSIALTADTYRLVVEDQIQDSLGGHLDGDIPGGFATPESNNFPSGNDQEGGDFNFQIKTKTNIVAPVVTLQKVVDYAVDSVVDRFKVLSENGQQYLVDPPDKAVKDSHISTILITANPPKNSDPSVETLEYKLDSNGKAPPLQFALDFEASPSSSVLYVDHLTTAMNEAIIAEMAAVLGKRKLVAGEKVVTLWFDPVDFNISTGSGSITYSNQQGLLANSIPGAAMGIRENFQVVVLPASSLGDLRIDLTGANQVFRGGATFMEANPAGGALSVVLKTSFQGHLLDREQFSLVFDPSLAGPTQRVASLTFGREALSRTESGNGTRAEIAPASTLVILSSIVNSAATSEAARGRQRLLNGHDATRLDPLDKFVREIRSRGYTAERSDEVGEMLDLLNVLVGDWVEEFKVEVLRRLKSETAPADDYEVVPRSETAPPAADSPPAAGAESNSSEDAAVDVSQAPPAARPHGVAYPGTTDAATPPRVESAKSTDRAATAAAADEMASDE